MVNRSRRTSGGAYQPLRSEGDAPANMFPSLGRRVSPERDERPAERPLDRHQRSQPQPTVNKTIAPGQVCISQDAIRHTACLPSKGDSVDQFLSSPTLQTCSILSNP